MSNEIRTADEALEAAAQVAFAAMMRGNSANVAEEIRALAACIPERDDEVMLSEDGMKAETVDFPPGTVICVGPSGRLRVETGEVVGCSIILSSSRIPERDDEALVEGVARTLCHQRHPCWSIVAEIMECNVDGQADEFREHARATLSALREAGALK